MWRERHFETWFLRHRELPGGEKLTFVDKQRALRRVVDLLFVDRTGGLVLIEVKNEGSSRAVVGQALEYLSQYEGVQLDALMDELSTERAGELAAEVSKAGITQITRRRRIYLAAPVFDFATQAAVSLLNDRFVAADLYLGLLLIEPKANDLFGLRAIDPVKPKALRSLRGQCGVNARGRLYFVLPKGATNMVVNLGRIKEGRLRRPKGRTATQRLVRRRAGTLVPYDGPLSPELGDFGSIWRHKRRPRHAIVLARARESQSDGQQFVYFALEENGTLIGFRIRSSRNFAESYAPANARLQWDALLSGAV